MDSYKLIRACINGCYKDLKDLPKYENVDTNTKNGTNASTPLTEASRRGYINIVKLLLNYKINGDYVTDPRIRNDRGLTALYWAVRNGYTEIVKLLLDYSLESGFIIDINLQDGCGNSPLHLTCYQNMYTFKNSKIVSMLLDYKVGGLYVTNTHLKTDNGFKAIDFVRENSEIGNIIKSYNIYKDKVNEFIPSYYHYILTILIQKNRFIFRYNLPNEILTLIKKYGIIACGKYN